MASGGGGSAAARMDPEAATELVRKGATLLLLDVPQRTLFGIDTQMFSVGPKFKGMKMVPPGPHFVYYCSPNRHGNEFAPTVGFFLTTHPSEVIVRKWDVQEEWLIKLSEEEDIRYSEAVRRFEFDDQLGPYNLDSYGDWKQLSNYLSPNVIERLEPIGGEITIAWESSWIDKAPQSDMERRLVEQLREGKFAKNAPVQSERRGCYYTTIPASVKHKDISGGDLTALNLDKTSLLEIVLAKNYEGQEDLFLGELQFAFIAFMMGQSLEAFMQWKALVSLLLSCSEAPLHTRTNMFIKFIRTLYYQLKHGFQHTQDSKSGEMGNSLCLDEAWFSRDIFLYRLSKDFFTVVFEATVVDGDLLSWARKLKSLLETTFGWDLEDNAVNLIDEDDERVEKACPGTVSCADILALAARDSLVLVGGPTYPVLTGRRDSAQSFYHDVVAGGGIPPPNATYAMTLAAFARRGRKFTERETVALLGAHSIGKVRCRFFADRIYDFAGTGSPDDSIDPDMVGEMRAVCGGGGDGDDGAAPMEMGYYRQGREVGFGAHYYGKLLEGRGILRADQQLTAGSTVRWVRVYASGARGEKVFREDFAHAMVKLSALAPLTGSAGQVRISCSKPVQDN